MAATRRYRVRLVEERPDGDEMVPWILYVVGDAKIPFCAAMLCPCECRAPMYMSLVENDEPRWRVKVYSDGTPTMIPSVWRIVGCHSHFFIFRGRVAWARDRLGRGR